METGKLTSILETEKSQQGTEKGENLVDKFANTHALVRQEVVKQIVKDIAEKTFDASMYEMQVERYTKFFAEMAEYIAVIRENPTPESICSAYLAGLSHGMPPYVVYTILTEAFLDDERILRAVDSVDPQTLRYPRKTYVH